MDNLSKRILIIFLLVATIVGFILSYNSFLLDEDISRYYFVLNKIKYAKKIEEKEQIRPFLKKIILDEIAKDEPENITLLKLQTAWDILNLLKDKRQFEDIILFLEDAVKVKEQKRNRFLLKLDKFIIWLLGNEFKTKPHKNYLIRKKEILKEIEETNQIIKKQKLLYELANIYMNTGDVQKAKEIFKEVMELSPESRYALKSEYKLALLDKLTNNFDSAITIFEKITQREDEELSLYSKYFLSGIYESKNNFLNAKNIYDGIISKYSDLYINCLSLFKKGYIYLYLLNDYKSSLDIYEDIRIKFPRDNLIKHIDTKIIPRIGIYYRNLGFNLLGLKKYQEALDTFLMALKIIPEDSLSFIGEAIAYLWLGEKEKALELGFRARRMSPEDPYILVNLGYIYTYLNMFEEAIKEYKKCIIISPKKKEAYYNLSYIYINKGDLDSALHFLQIAISVSPKFAEAYNNLGYLFWLKKNFAEAISAFKKAVQLRPDFTPAHFNLGLALVITGRYREAKEEFVKILEYEPNNEIVKANLKEVERLLSGQ